MIDRLARHLAHFAPAAVMSAWATVMLHTLAAGHINRLLSPMFRSYVLIAAVALFALSALHLFLYQPNGTAASAPRQTWRQLGRWLLLLLPVLAAAVLSPAALSSTTAQLRTSLDSSSGVASLPRLSDASAENARAALEADPNQPVPMEVTDLITLGRSPDLVKKFDGRSVKVVGLYNGDHALKLMRWIMWCCAADAQPASVNLRGLTGGPWHNDQWLEITGRARFPSTLGRVVPEIEVDSAKPADEPDEPFLSP